MLHHLGPSFARASPEMMAPVIISDGTTFLFSLSYCRLVRTRNQMVNVRACEPSRNYLACWRD